MTIYVDNFKAPWKLTVWCHMIATTPEELHTFAKTLGLKRIWAQGNPRFPHYDLTPAKKVMAIKLGAKEVTVRELAMVQMKQMGGLYVRRR